MQQIQSAEQLNMEQAKLLENAFRDFNQISENLSNFYQGLEQQVEQLNQQLKRVRNEKQQQEQEKLKYANRLANLLQILPAGVIVIDEHGYIRECNQAAKELFPVTLEKQLWRDIVDKNFRPRWDDGHDITLINGRCVNISTQSLQFEPGQIILIKEVTETRQLQNQFNDLKRLSAMGQMAASLAHQVRTPLSSALLYASHMRHSDLRENIRNQYSDKIVSRLRDLEQLVEDILLFARGGRFDVSTISTSTLLAAIQNLVMNSYADDSVEIISEINEVELHANQHAVISVLENLINNAIQSAEQVDVILSIQTSAYYFEIEVSDNGPGIPESIQKNLFEPFFSTKQKGTGLGLGIVDAVVKAHRGTLTFSSTVHKGTCFTIQLPLYDDTCHRNLGVIS